MNNKIENPDGGITKDPKWLKLIDIFDQIAYDTEVLKAFSMVDRALFVPPLLRQYAYEDIVLPIGWGQTISQPSLVAQMVDDLEINIRNQQDQIHRTGNILDVGTGSGFSAAILSYVVPADNQVYTIERIPELALRAHKLFERLNYTNIKVLLGNGSLGFPGNLKFDAILVSAVASNKPEALINQLAEGGHIVIPLKATSGEQFINIGIKKQGLMKWSQGEEVTFVPLVEEEDGLDELIRKELQYLKVYARETKLPFDNVIKLWAQTLDEPVEKYRSFLYPDTES